MARSAARPAAASTVQIAPPRDDAGSTGEAGDATSRGCRGKREGHIGSGGQGERRRADQKYRKKGRIKHDELVMGGVIVRRVPRLTALSILAGFKSR